MNNFRYICFVIIIAAGFVLSACSKAATVELPPADAVTIPASKVAANDTIRFLQDRVNRDPDDFIAFNKLASEYMQQMRETGDVSYLDLAMGTAKKSLAILPAEQNKGGLAALARAEFSSHQFAAARDHAMQLLDIDPQKAYVYQLLGDAHLELGAYEEAKAAFEKLDELTSGQSLSRVGIEQRLSKLAVLHGDVKKAESHMRNALRLAEASKAGSTETIAWCKWQLGEMAMARGELDAAEQNFNSSLKVFPDYFAANEALGHLTATRGDVNGAIAIYEKSVAVPNPDPAAAVMLGDLYMLAGRIEDAERQYAVFDEIARADIAKGSLHGRITSMFYANHDKNTLQACGAAAKDYETRRDIYGADLVAWTCYKAGRLEEARVAMKDALRLGTKDALLFYHAGMIENALGNSGEARRLIALSLKTNPYFDLLQAAKAREVLAELR
jgi:tetratricopeptide (TPR) repeat protein